MPDRIANMIRGRRLSMVPAGRVADSKPWMVGDWREERGRWIDGATVVGGGRIFGT